MVNCGPTDPFEDWGSSESPADVARERKRKAREARVGYRPRVRLTDAELERARMVAWWRLGTWALFTSYAVSIVVAVLVGSDPTETQTVWLAVACAVPGVGTVVWSIALGELRWSRHENFPIGFAGRTVLACWEAVLRCADRVTLRIADMSGGLLTAPRIDAVEVKTIPGDGWSLDPEPFTAVCLCPACSHVGVGWFAEPPERKPDAASVAGMILPRSMSYHRYPPGSQGALWDAVREYRESDPLVVWRECQSCGFCWRQYR